MESNSTKTIESVPKTKKKPKAKRKANPDGWQKTKAKVNRALGKEYKNTRGVVVPEKVFSDKLCGCKRKCNLKITPTEREGNFAQFYALGNSALQNLYIRGQVHISDVKKRCPKDSSRGPKNCTLLYYIRVKKHGIRVCKKYFEDTFQIGSKRIRDCTLKESIIDIVSEKRGQRNPKNKIDTTDIEEFLKSYQNPADACHNRIMLPPELTIKKIYQLYVTKTESEGKPPCKEKFFYSVAKKKFDVKFLKVKKDVTRTEPFQDPLAATSDAGKVIVIKVEPDRSQFFYQEGEDGKLVQFDNEYQKFF